MGEKHLIKNFTFMASKYENQEANLTSTEQTTNKEKRAPFCRLYHTKLTLVYLHLL